MPEPLWEEASASPGRVRHLAATAVSDAATSFVSDMDKMLRHMQAGGGVQEMEALSRAYRTHGEVVRVLNDVAAGLSTAPTDGSTSERES